MVFMFLSAALLSPCQDTVVLGLEETVARAAAVSPEMIAAEGAISAPRGARAESFWPFPFNPTVEYGRVRRRTPTGTVHDRQWAVTQEIEIGGQWLFRRGAANRLVRSAEERVADTRRLVGLDARLAYLNLAISERRAALTDSNAVFAERLADLAVRQLDAGEINRLEHNAAVLEAARARSAAERARAEQGARAAELGRLLALGGDTVATTRQLPDVPILPADAYAVALNLALGRRSDLFAARYGAEAADRAYTAARLSFLPNLTVSAFSGREEGTDDLFGFAVGFTVPLFHRGQSASGLAAAERAFAGAQLLATERLIQSDVRIAVERYVRARRAEQLFATDVLRAATENVTLTELALSEGEVSVTDVVVLRTAAVNAQLEYLNVLTDATAAWFEFAAALNTSPAELATLLNTGMEDPR